MAESKRGLNWGEKESIVLLSEIAKVHDTLFSRLSSAISNAQKKRQWESIVDAVNAIGGQRDLQSCKKRWRDLKAIFLQNQRHAGQTGGGKPAGEEVLEGTSTSAKQAIIYRGGGP